MSREFKIQSRQEIYLRDKASGYMFSASFSAGRALLEILSWKLIQKQELAVGDTEAF